MKRAVICVHGFCEHAEMWASWMLQFPTSFPEILCPDLPGFGSRKDEIMPETIDDMAHWMASWLKEHNIDTVIWIGHSMGGYIGAAFARIYPEHIEALIMFHSTFSADSEQKKANREKSIAFIKEHGNSYFLEQFALNLFAHDQAIDPAKLQIAFDWVKHTSTSSIISASRAMMQRNSHIEWLKETTLPICFISGKSDAHISYSDLCVQASYVKQGTIEIIDKCGHLGMLEYPEASCEIVHTFIRLHTDWLKQTD